MDGSISMYCTDTRIFPGTFSPDYVPTIAAGYTWVQWEHQGEVWQRSLALPEMHAPMGPHSRGGTSRGNIKRARRKMPNGDLRGIPSMPCARAGRGKLAGALQAD